MKKKPYYVEQGNTGCYACNKGITWDIIDPNGVALGQSWGDKDEAEWIAEQLSYAYEFGLKRGRESKAGVCRYTELGKEKNHDDKRKN